MSDCDRLPAPRTGKGFFRRSRQRARRRVDAPVQDATPSRLGSDAPEQAERRPWSWLGRFGRALAARALTDAINSPTHGAATLRRLSDLMRSVDATGHKLVRIGADRRLMVHRWAPYRTARARTALSNLKGRVLGIAFEVAAEVQAQQLALGDHYFEGNPFVELAAVRATYPIPDLPAEAATDLLVPLPASIQGDDRARLEHLLRYSRLSGAVLHAELDAARGRLAEAVRGGPRYLAHAAVGEAAVLLSLLVRAQRTCHQLAQLSQDDIDPRHAA